MTTPTNTQIEAAFEEYVKRPFLNRCEPAPYTFGKTPTGFYCSPHLRDRLTDFAAGYTAMNNTRPTGDDVERVAANLADQMEEQDDSIPSSVARDRGLVWLEGWFDLSAAIKAIEG